MTGTTKGIAEDPLGLTAVFRGHENVPPVGPVHDLPKAPPAPRARAAEPDRSLASRYRVGVDEVGRGCLAGPVVCCAAILPDDEDIPEEIRPWIRDSKKLSAKRRVKVAKGLLECGAIYAFGAASAPLIDEINILQATMLAMIRAIRRLPINQSLISSIVIDGEFVPIDLPAPARAVVDGDSEIPEISAASILAKVKRDNLMAALGGRYPEYSWERNAGYGTPAHLAAIRQAGVTSHHRRSFLKRI